MCAAMRAPIVPAPRTATFSMRPLIWYPDRSFDPADPRTLWPEPRNEARERMMLIDLARRSRPRNRGLREGSGQAEQVTEPAETGQLKNPSIPALKSTVI